MNITKRRSSVAILCVAISLGLMAFSASAAQAATWMVNGSNVEKDIPIWITSTVTSPSGELTLLSKVAGISVAISCKKIQFPKATMHAAGIISAEFWWLECTTKLNGTLSAACKPQETIKIAEKDESLEEKGKDDDKLEGKTTIVLGPECAIGEKFELSGIYWIEDTSSQWEVEKTSHTVTESKVAAEFLGGLFFGKNPASIDGEIKLEIKLSEEKEGKKVEPAKFSALF